jgi:hypothetical protein
VYQNGASAAERTADKETSVQKLDRYIADFRQKAIRNIEGRVTGHVALTVSMSHGNVHQRQLVVDDVVK